MTQLEIRLQNEKFKSSLTRAIDRANQITDKDILFPSRVKAIKTELKRSGLTNGQSDLVNRVFMSIINTRLFHLKSELLAK